MPYDPIIVQVKGDKTTAIVSTTGAGKSTGNSFGVVNVTGQNNIVASIVSDTLKVRQGSGILITTDSPNDVITIAATGGSAFDQFARDTSNAAFEQANSAAVRANTLVTDNVPETTTNLYFTSARVRANVGNTSPISYDSTTGIFGHEDSLVTPGTYGNSTFVSQVTVDSKGHVTSVTNVQIDTASSAFSQAAFDKANSANVLAQSAFNQANSAAVRANTLVTDNVPETTTNLYFTSARVRANISNTAPINYNSTTGVISHSDSGVTATTYGNANFVSQVTVDSKGHVTSASNVAIDHSIAQGAFSQANSSNVLAQTARDTANGAYTTANAAFSQANSAALRANTLVTDNVPETTTNLYFTSARVRANISNSAPINYNPTTGVISHSDSLVTPGTYGNSTFVSQVSVDSKGHVTSVTNVAIDQSFSQAAFDKANSAYSNANTAIYTATQIRANISNTAPINYNSTTGVISHADSGVGATTYGSATQIPRITVDSKGHVTSASNVAINGLPAATANGQLLIGNTVSGSFDVNTLTQGTGISITNGQGTITIAATGGSALDQFARDQANAAFSQANSAALRANNLVTDNVPETTTNLYFTAARVRANISNTAPVNYNSTTGVISHALSGVSSGGYGNPSNTLSVSVDSFGHLTTVTNTPIAISASQVTSGILSVARGGTGQTAASIVNGAVLIGNTVSGGYDIATLTQGTNITITNDKGSITISSTGGGTGGASNSFTTINVAGQANVVADSNNDTLVFIAGNGISIVTDATNDTITITSTISQNALPAGSIQYFSQNSVPQFDFFPANGSQNVVRTAYPELFSAIGVQYGSGDGANTFGVPYIAPKFEKWIIGTNLPIGMEEHSISTLLDGRVVVVGGQNVISGNVSSNVWFGNVSGNSIVWNVGTGLPAVRYQHTTTYLTDGRLLVIGGRDGSSNPVNSCYFGVVSGTTVTWTSGTNLPSVRTEHATAQLPNNQILVTGGLTSFQNATFGTISGDTITWQEGTPMPLERARHTFNIIPKDGGRGLILGGRDSLGVILDSSYFASFPGGNVITWVETTPIPTGRTEHTITVLNDGHLFLSGGVGNFTVPFPYVGRIDENSIIWTQSVTSPVTISDRYSHASSLLNDGRIIICGGDNGVTQSISNTFIISPTIAGIRVRAGTTGAGTALPAATANGQLLIGNTVSSSFDISTLTPGSGIQIINGKGSVTISANSLVTDNVPETTTNLYFTATRVRANISNTAPINYNSTTGVISHADSGVGATTYGNTLFVSQITVDSKGHVTSASNVAIDQSLAQSARDTANGAFLKANGSTQQSFTTISVSGQTDVVADSNADTLTIVSGNGISVTTNSISDSITISLSDLELTTFDDFIGGGFTVFSSSGGQLGWYYDPNGSGGVKPEQEINHPGIVNLYTGGTSGSRSWAYIPGSSTTPGFLKYFDKFNIQFVVKVRNMGSNTQFAMGLGSSIGYGGEYIRFEKLYADSNIFAVTSNGTTTRVDTLAPTVVDDWYRFGIRKSQGNTTNVIFSVNGTDIANIGTTLPTTTAGLAAQFLIDNNAAANKELWIDLWSAKVGAVLPTGIGVR